MALKTFKEFTKNENIDEAFPLLGLGGLVKSGVGAVVRSAPAIAGSIKRSIPGIMRGVGGIATNAAVRGGINRSKTTGEPVSASDETQEPLELNSVGREPPVLQRSPQTQIMTPRPGGSYGVNRAPISTSPTDMLMYGMSGRGRGLMNSFSHPTNKKELYENLKNKIKKLFNDANNKREIQLMKKELK
jgi:hypothetical protein